MTSYIMMILCSMNGNMHSSTIGLMWAIANIFSTTVYVVSLRHVIHFDKGPLYESIFFPNFTSIFITGSLSLFFDPKYANTYSLYNHLVIIVSGLTAFLTAYSSGLALDQLSSTTYSMMGALNKIVMGFTGFAFINETVDKYKIYALLTGSFATVLYTYSLYAKQKAVKQ